ncbi:MAG: hypothetical protein AAFU38_05810 [Bacteroidota bacterium]
MTDDTARAIRHAAAKVSEGMYAPDPVRFLPGREWLIDGSLVYTLEHDGWHRGEERTRNAATVTVQIRGATLEEQHAFATEIQAFLNSRTDD